MHPLLIEGSRALTPVLAAALKNLPSSQLARYGLFKGSTIGLAPLLGGAVGGALAMAFIVPSSRKWILDNSAKLISELKQSAEHQYENVRQGVFSEAEVVTAENADA